MTLASLYVGERLSMKNRSQPVAPNDEAPNEQELAAAAGRANLRVDVAKQNVRLAKEELKRARKRYKEAKREAKRARKRADSARKAWKQARRRRAASPSGSPESPEKPQKPAALRGKAARSARRKGGSRPPLSASSAAPRRG